MVMGHVAESDGGDQGWSHLIYFEGKTGVIFIFVVCLFLYSRSK